MSPLQIILAICFVLLSNPAWFDQARILWMIIKACVLIVLVAHEPSWD